MKIKLPHRTVVFTEEQKKASAEERVVLVNEVLQEKINENLTVEEYFTENFGNSSVTVAMDMLSYFIIKEYNQQEDIISRDGVKKMKKGNKNSVNFSNLTEQDKVSLGLDNLVENY